VPISWQSSWAVEVGATRYLENGLHVSAGYAFIQDSTPTRGFNPLVPDQDMHVFSAGVGGQFEQFTWDATYQFTWGPGRSVSGSQNGATVAGDYSYAAHALSLSFGWRF
jgi:long-chain fatty acid transport protein